MHVQERMPFFLMLQWWALVITVVVAQSTRPTLEEEELQSLIQAARISEARWKALKYLQLRPSLELQKKLATVYVQAFDDALSQPGRDFVEEIQEATTHKGDFARFHHEYAKQDTPDCIPVPSIVETTSTSSLQLSHAEDADNKKVDSTVSLLQWDDCCSILPTPTQQQSQSEMVSALWEPDNREKDVEFESKCPVRNPCCALFAGSSAYLRLPILQEPIVSIKLQMFGDDTGMTVVEKTLSLEQDGYLRPFDPAGVLWPTGYLLTLCVSNPRKCGINHLFHRAWTDFMAEIVPGPFAIELGAGLGAPSIALSEFLKPQLTRLRADDTRVTLRELSRYPFTRIPSMNATGDKCLVVAADSARHALASIHINAHINEAQVHPVFLNHTDPSDALAVQIRSFPNGGGYSLVMGSSLQSFFENPQNPESVLWKVLDILMNKNAPNALAVFVHGRSALAAPLDGSFELLLRIPGDVFDMKTRWGDSSDFEIYVFRRGRHVYRDVEL